MDERAFERLYQQHCAALRAYVRRRHPPDEVDEALAEVWLAAWRRRADLPADALPWLYGTARRVLANQRRGRSRRLALAARMTGGPAPPLEIPDRALANALAQLAPNDREALLLTAWEGLPAASAAQAMGCSVSAFNSRLRRARRRLERELPRLRPINQPADPARLEAKT